MKYSTQIMVLFFLYSFRYRTIFPLIFYFTFREYEIEVGGEEIGEVRLKREEILIEKG